MKQNEVTKTDRVCILIGRTLRLIFNAVVVGGFVAIVIWAAVKLLRMFGVL